MKTEVIKRLIADGWEWVVCDKDGQFSVLNTRPVFNERLVRFELDTLEDEKADYNFIPSCLFEEFPIITFSNSPIELKTLLSDEVEEKVHRIKIGEFLKTIKKSVKVEITDQYGVKTKGWAVDLIKSGYFVYENIEWFDTEDGGIRVFLEGFIHPRNHMQILEENEVEE